MNTAEYVTEIKESQFLNEISKTLSSGYSIVPFIGAGLSADSGILMGQQFNLFLSNALHKTLSEYWCVTTFGWPTCPSSIDELIEEVNRSKNKIKNNLRSKKLTPKSLTFSIKERGFNLIIDYLSPNKPQKNTAIKWYQILQYLSRVKIDKNDKQHRLTYQESDSTIIDSFNAHITRGRKPNLGHSMVSSLLRSFRSRIILTTNFDTLIEESCSTLSRDLQVFAVSSKGSLPAFQTVYSQDSLIKLHGDILETRADETLQHSPTSGDLTRFFEYLRGPFFNKGETGQTNPALSGFCQSNLLVLGYSGDDHRCMQMIEFVLSIDPAFKVYWVCNSVNTLKHLDSYFKEKTNIQKRVYCTVNNRTDLLLYSLYQSVNNSLPGGGFNYEFTHAVPPKVWTSGRPPIDENQKSNIKSFLHNRIEKRKPAKSESLQTKNIQNGDVIIFDRKSDVTGPASYIFDLLENERKTCIWLDLDDYSSVRNLEFQILSLISLKQGRFQAEHINLVPSMGLPKGWKNTHNQKHIERIFRILSINPFQIWVFLYGRNAPGACAGLTGKFWNHSEYKKLSELIISWQELGVNFIYMPLSNERFQRNQEKEKKVIELKNLLYQRSKKPMSTNLFKKSVNSNINLARV